jgi:hypothetical protein
MRSRVRKFWLSGTDATGTISAASSRVAVDFTNAVVRLGCALSGKSYMQPQVLLQVVPYEREATTHKLKAQRLKDSQTHVHTNFTISKVCTLLACWQR